MITSSSECRVQKWLDHYARLWRRGWDQGLGLLQNIPIDEKLDRERSADRGMDELEQMLRECPELRWPARDGVSGGGAQPGWPGLNADPPSAEARLWQERFLLRLRQLAAECLGYPRAGVPLLFDSAGLGATREFLWRARAFDPHLSREGLLQALRNFWVFHSLQLVMGQPVAFSSAAFAYSMLYPWTDNYLDDSRTSPARKSAFGEWLAARLQGDGVWAPDPHAEQVSRLIGIIESSFPRARFAEVYRGLSAIHAAQMNSLKQQTLLNGQPAEETLLVTIRKGGTSVVADAYLVRGYLSDLEREFAFGYGVVLQLMDDLQDVRRDLAAGHATLFTEQARAGLLDRITARLWGMISEVLGRLPHVRRCRAEGLPLLFRENCRQLILQCVALHPDLYSLPFAEQLECCSPFRFCYLRRRQKSLGARYQRLITLLERRSGNGSGAFRPAIPVPGFGWS